MLGPIAGVLFGVSAGYLARQSIARALHAVADKLHTPPPNQPKLPATNVAPPKLPSTNVAPPLTVGPPPITPPKPAEPWSEKLSPEAVWLGEPAPPAHTLAEPVWLGGEHSPAPCCDSCSHGGSCTRA